VVNLDMSYSYDRRATEVLTPQAIYDQFLAKIDRLQGELGPYWEAFRKEVSELGTAPYEKRIGTGLASSLYVESNGFSGPNNRKVPSAKLVYQEWEHSHKSKLQALEREKLDAITWIVQYFKGTQLGKPERIPRDQAEVPWKPGCIILSERAKIYGHDFDSDRAPTFTLHSESIGTETDQGTIVGKRVIHMPDKHVQYLLKPRSARAEKVYRAKERLRDVEYQLRQVDYLTPEKSEELNAEKERLLKLIK
jgi:hypothetical protein